MKTLLVAVALLVAIEGWTEAKPGWAAYPGFQNTRGNNGRGLPWAQPQPMENQNSRFTVNSDVEWICQNPRTNDIMIIVSDDTRNTPQQNPDRRPWQWHNVPPWHQKEHHPHGNHWPHNSLNQPIIIIQETPNTDDKTQTPLSFPTTTEIPNNNNNDKQTQPPHHGGEGSIDIRIGAE